VVQAHAAQAHDAQHSQLVSDIHSEIYVLEFYHKLVMYPEWFAMVQLLADSPTQVASLP
jgi:hypothetical protein